MLFLLLVFSSALATIGDSNLKSALDKSAANFPTIEQQFDQSRSKYKDILSSRGFDYYKQTIVVRTVNGLLNSYLDKWINYLYQNLYIPQEDQKQFNTTIQLSLWTDAQVWATHKVMVSSHTSGDSHLTFLLTHNNADQKTTDWVVASGDFTLNVAPDLMFLKQSKSYLGGLWGEEHYELKQIPPAITEEDIETILEFFYIVCYGAIHDNLGTAVGFLVSR